MRIRQAVANAIKEKQQYSGLHRVVCELVMKDPEFAERQKALIERSIARLQELISLASKAKLTWDIDVQAAAFIVHRVVFDLSQDYVTGCCEFERDRAIEALSDMIYRYLFVPSR
jgi:hypothetical protein